jgi:hypothetical protein
VPAAATAREARVPDRARDLRDGLLVGLAGLILLLLADALVRDQPRPRGDELIYDLIARDPLGTHTFPFGYRIGVPALVHLSPFGDTVSFSVVAWLASAACGAVVFVLLRRFAVGRGLAAALAFCLVLCPPLLVVSLRQGRGVDPESLLVMLAGTLAIVDRRPRALAAAVLVGAFVRESALFLIPFAYAVWAERPLDRAAAGRALAAGLPGVLAYAALRLALPTVGRDQVLGYDSLLGGRADVVRETLREPWTAARRLIGAFGPLWLVAPFALRDLPFARRGLVLVSLCVVAMTFAQDWGRIVLLAAPVIYVAAAHVLDRRRALAIAAVVLFVAMDVGYAVHMQHSGVEDGLINGPLPSYPIR